MTNHLRRPGVGRVVSPDRAGRRDESKGQVVVPPEEASGVGHGVEPDVLGHWGHYAVAVDEAQDLAALGIHTQGTGNGFEPGPGEVVQQGVHGRGPCPI